MVAEHEGGSSPVVEIVVGVVEIIESSSAASWASDTPPSAKISARSEAKRSEA